MKISKQLFVLLLFSTICWGCGSNKQEKEITRIVTEWHGKEVIFPDDLVFTRFEQDTLEYQVPKSDYKILLYVDSVGCTSCKLQLHDWRKLIEEVDSLTSGTVPVLLFFHPKDKRELSYLLKRDDLDVPVCLDESDRLNTINQFPSREDLQCFLLDKDNRVVYIGNPIHNQRIKEMYLSRIAQGNYQTERATRNTVIEAKELEFNLGTLKRGEPATIIAKLNNIGEAPFIIYNTRASCGCTDISYNKEPVLPGSTMEVKITYNAEDAGFFNRTVSIYGNTDNSPLVITLKGNSN